jgi:hypothetical protein
MEKIRIGLIGDTDVEGNRYYFTRSRVPAQLDISDCVIHAWPWERGGKFGLDITFRRYDPNRKNSQRAAKKD